MMGSKLCLETKEVSETDINKLLGDYKTKMRKEEGESGTNPEPLSEAEIILQEIEEKMKSAKIDLVSISAKESEQQKN